jgi:hypothetical protein
LTKRMRTLLLAAADAFDEGTSPFHPEWLGKHRVTFEECMSLSGSVAAACRNLARLDKIEGIESLIRNAVDDPKQRDYLINVYRIHAYTEKAAEVGLPSPEGGKP